mgnify:CR=1 FL=1
MAFKNPVKIPSDKKLKSFSIAFALICLAAFIVINLTIGRGVMWWVALEGAVWGFIGIWQPFIITPVYWVLGLLGLILGTINTTIILGLIFYLFFTPAAIVLRMRGKDPLALAIKRNAKTYWEPLDAAEQTPDKLERSY